MCNDLLRALTHCLVHRFSIGGFGKKLSWVYPKIFKGAQAARLSARRARTQQLKAVRLFAGSTVDLLVLREGKAVRCSIRRAPIEMTEEVRKNRRIQNISEHRLDSEGKEKERVRHVAKESSKKRSEDASKEIVNMLPRSGGVDSGVHGVSSHGGRVSGGDVDGTSDAVLESLRDKAIATRTPPKISHKELLTIAVR